MTSANDQPADQDETTPPTPQPKDPVTGTTGNATGEKRAAENEKRDPVG